MSEEKNNRKKLEVVEGIGNLDISPVYDHLKSAKPTMQDEKPKNIVIPPVKKKIEEEQDQEDIEDEVEEYEEDEFDDIIDDDEDDEQEDN